jgi:hypothetical protein
MQDVSAKLMTRFAECPAQQMQVSPAVTTVEEEAAPVAEPSTRVEETGVPGASSGVSTAEAEPAIPGASSGVSSATAARPTDDVLDLGEASREAVLKRALPIVGGVVALLILIRIIRR